MAQELARKKCQGGDVNGFKRDPGDSDLETV